MEQTALNDLKKLINSLSKEQLQQPLLYMSKEYSISGVVLNVEKAKENLYYTGEDDPSKLYTKKQLLEDYDKEDIEEMDIEIPKGSIVITF